MSADNSILCETEENIGELKMTNCQYHKICALYEFGSFRCGWFHQRCKYHHEFAWYDKETVIKHVDRIRMEQVNKLEQVFDGVKQ